MSGFADVVRAHHGDSDGVLVAGREPCLSIAHDESTNVAGRSFQVVPPDELHELELRPSWAMAVLLCPGDGTGTVADWVRSTDRDPDRIVHYLHPDTDTRDALGAWHEAGLPIRSTWTVRDWRELHKHFGAHWNNVVHDDFRETFGEP